MLRPRQEQAMGEMKSAFDRAWERAEKLGKLSPEELQRRREEELTLIGQGLAQRYLERGHADVLTEEVDRYSGEEREIALKATLSNLVAAIGVADKERTTRAVAGISGLAAKDSIGEMLARIEALTRQYEQEKQQRYEREREEIHRAEREILHQLRISGSAVAEVNIEASQAWEAVSAGLYAQFEERLQQLKGELCHLLGLG